jgi:hypothetical protein
MAKKCKNPYEVAFFSMDGKAHDAHQSAALKAASRTPYELPLVGEFVKLM